MNQNNIDSLGAALALAANADAEAKLASAEPGHVWMWATKTGLFLFATKELAEMMNKGRGASTYIQPVAVPVIGMGTTPQPAPDVQAAVAAALEKVLAAVKDINR